MRLHQVINNTVTNIALFADGEMIPNGWVSLQDEVSIGMVADGVGGFVIPNAPALSTDPRDYELTPGQFEYLLVDSELDDALEAAKVSTKAARGNSPAAKEAEAQFKMALHGDSFDFDMTLAMIVAMAAHIPAGITIDEAYLTPFWLKAAAK